MICPEALSFMPGIMHLDTYKSPFTFPSIIISQSETLPSASGSKPCAFPALLMRISIACHSAGRLAIAFCTSSKFRTSKVSVYTSVFVPVLQQVLQNFFSSSTKNKSVVFTSKSCRCCFSYSGCCSGYECCSHK